nr:hypothetical protein [Tanacetum cinerariifolium]
MIGYETIRTLANVEFESILILGLPCCLSSSSLRCLELSWIEMQAQLVDTESKPEEAPSEAGELQLLGSTIPFMGEEFVVVEPLGTRIDSSHSPASSSSTTPLSHDHPLTIVSPTPTPTRALFHHRTARMTVRAQPFMSLSHSARVTEAVALLDLAFCKRYRYSYKTPSSSSSLAFPVRKRLDDKHHGLDDEGHGLYDEDHGLKDKDHGLDDEGRSLDEEGLSLEGSEEEVIHEDQQRAAPVVETSMGEPPRIGLWGVEAPRVSAPPVLTPPSPEWSSGLILISPAPSAVPSPIPSPMISVIVPSHIASPVATPTVTISVDEDQFIKVKDKQEKDKIGTKPDKNEKRGKARRSFYNNGDDDDEDCIIAITSDFLITDYLSMGDEHLDTIPEKESDEFNKSSVEDLVPNPSEFEDECECDMPDCDESQTTNFSTFSNPLFGDSTSSDDESSHEEVIHEMSFKTYSNPLFNLDEEVISSDFNPIHNEDLDSTSKNDRFDTDSYLLESSLNRDNLMISSLKIDSLLAEFVGELIFLESIPPGVDEANCDPEEDIHLVERLLYDNSSPRLPKEFVVGNKMHKAFPLPVTEFPLPKELPTAREDKEKRSYCQEDRTAINVKKNLPVKGGSYAKLVPHVPPCIIGITETITSCTRTPCTIKGKFKQWQFRIQQYLQHEHYALWEVIEFGDLYEVPTSTTDTTTTDTTSGETSTKSGRTVTLTAEDIQKKKNDVKARTTLLSLPDEHQLRFTKHSSENEDGNTACVPTASTNVPTASASVTTIIQDTACAYIASQSSGSQIKFEDINQIDEDDMEEMDIKWNMSLLSMRADKFWKRTGKKISIQGSDVTGFDKSKVKCFNCHKMGYFARECRAPISQDKGRRDNFKQGEDHALVADEEALTEFALMANTSTKSKKLETLKQEKDGVDVKLAGLLTASKDLDYLIESQREDKNKEGLGYSAVLPPPAQLYSSLKKDLSWIGLPECKDDTVTDYSRPEPTLESSSDDDKKRNPSVSKTVASPIIPKPFVKFVKASDSQSKSKTNETKTPKKSPVKYAEQYRKTNKKPNVRENQRNWNNLKSHQLGPEFVMKKKACYNCGDFNHLAYDCRKRVKIGITRSQNNTYKSPAHRPGVYKPHGPPMRPMRSNMNAARPNRTSFNKPAHSYTNRPFQRKSALRSQYRAPWVPTVNRNFPLVNRKFSIGSRNFPTANRNFPTASRKFPNGSMKFSTADIGMKRKAGSSQNNINDKGYWDSGCSRHMTGNISYLSDYEPLNGGYVSFGHNLVRGLPTKCFENDHNCTACLKGKQHKAS